jgi:putative zinc finger/helix-turn-helix YgiT family protein
MKSPFTGGKVTKKVKYETYTFRKEKYTVKRYYFQCNDTGKTFSNAKVDDKVMENVYSQYREHHGIPSPSELKGLREKYGLSAHSMSKIAGIGVNQYGLYENGEMPTPLVGQKLSSLFDKETLLDNVRNANLGKGYFRVEEKIESYPGPKTFPLAKIFYGDFKEIISLKSSSIALSIKKPRWATCK